ncbi:hypothetical protein [Rickettsia tamurae]|uniref:hypothetical protein n=1 Tax=Rickettsia tamurae TaxID=334545 RepID=UPI00050A05FC|nr:hypothetical protein [Rickettsia tamurae]
MSKKQKLLDKFGSVYIDFVRDGVLTQMLGILNNTTKANKILAQKVNEISNESKEIIEIIVQETLDRCLHYTLFMLQEYEDEMALIMYDEDHNQYSLAEISDGLCGELYSEDGWIAKYSKYPNWKTIENIIEK